MENEKDNDKIVKGTVNENEHLTDHVVDNTKILDIKVKEELYYDEEIIINNEFANPSKDGFTFDHYEDENGDVVTSVKAGTEAQQRFGGC